MPKLALVVVSNPGSTTVTYEWRKIHRKDHIGSTKRDGVQRFFCHYPRATLKPGDKKKFIFSFKSDKVGMFNEEWELLTEPAVSQLPCLSLSGMGVADDELVQKREDFWRNFDHHMDVLCNVSDDGLDEFHQMSKTPTKVTPDIRDPQVFAEMFETNNRDRVLYYSRHVMEGFLDLLDNLDHLHRKYKGVGLLPKFEWSTKVSELEKLISQVENPYSRKTLEDQYFLLLQKAKRVPNDRAHSYSVIRNALSGVVSLVAYQDAIAREELNLAQLECFRIPPDDETEEQRAELKKREKEKQLEALKKSKKKPKTEEEEAAEMQSLINRLTENLTNKLLGQMDAA